MIPGRLPAVLAGPRPLGPDHRARLVASDGVARVLDAMGPDLPPTEWARRLGVTLERVLDTAEWLGVRLGGA